MIATEVFRGLLVVASLYQTIKCCCAEETGQVLKIWLRSSVFLWKSAFFLSERYNFVLFRPTWGNLNRFLVIFLDVNRSVCIWKWVYTKSEPTCTSSSWFAICLNEVSFSLHFFFRFFLPNFLYHLTFHCFLSHRTLWAINYAKL